MTSRPNIILLSYIVTALEDVDLNLEVYLSILNVAVTVYAGNGTISLDTVSQLTFTEGDDVGNSIISFSGPINAVNTALSSITYQGFMNWHGIDKIKVGVKDITFLGYDVSYFDSKSFPVITC